MATLRLPPGTPPPSVADFASLGMLTLPGHAATGVSQALKTLLAKRAPSMRVLTEMPVPQQAVGPEEAIGLMANLRSRLTSVPAGRRSLPASRGAKAGSTSGPTQAWTRVRGMRVHDVPPLSAADRADMFRPRSLAEGQRLALLERIRLARGGP